MVPHLFGISALAQRVLYLHGGLTRIVFKMTQLPCNAFGYGIDIDWISSAFVHLHNQNPPSPQLTNRKQLPQGQVSLFWFWPHVMAHKRIAMGLNFFLSIVICVWPVILVFQSALSSWRCEVQPFHVISAPFCLSCATTWIALSLWSKSKSCSTKGGVI